METAGACMYEENPRNQEEGACGQNIVENFMRSWCLYILYLVCAGPKNYGAVCTFFGCFNRGL